ncbi:hypothetical protein KFZ06_25880, partial [Salmonella enterica subsp. enterica serovar 1,4,[5],12:i:-]|nr:hypothetical protein [Salmonella enterica subsp. enterica serovar 1,4,[5],12:i:-]
IDNRINDIAIIATDQNKEATIKNVSKLLTQKRKDEIIGNLKRIDNRINDIAIIATDQNKEATIKNVSKLLTQKRKDEIIGNLK